MSRRKNSRTSMRKMRARRGRPSRRRGVILLVVLGLLALFTVIVLTFVIVARQTHQQSVIKARKHHYDESHEELLNQAALQVIRGTTSPTSVLGPHSLLEDLYGSGLSSEIAGIAAPATYILPPNGGFRAGNFPEFVMGEFGRGGMMYIKLAQAQIKPNGPFEAIPNYYTGRVITMTSGNAKGKSARITGYAP